MRTDSKMWKRCNWNIFESCFCIKNSRILKVQHRHERNVKPIAESNHTHTFEIKTKHWVKRERVRARATDNHRESLRKFMAISCYVYWWYAYILLYSTYFILQHISISLDLCYCFNKQRERLFSCTYYRVRRIHIG